MINQFTTFLEHLNMLLLLHYHQLQRYSTIFMNVLQQTQHKALILSVRPRTKLGIMVLEAPF